MFKILEKEYFSPKVVRLEVEAPLIARSRRAGHFVIVRCGDKGERIPLTIADSDVERGIITLVVQAVGESPPSAPSNPVTASPTSWVPSVRRRISPDSAPWYAAEAAWAWLRCCLSSRQ